jgi:hypothetical protein
MTRGVARHYVRPGRMITLAMIRSFTVRIRTLGASGNGDIDGVLVEVQDKINIY